MVLSYQLESHSRYLLTFGGLGGGGAGLLVLAASDSEVGTTPPPEEGTELLRG